MDNTKGKHTELKSCPFCKGEVELLGWETPSKKYDTTRIRCKTYGCIMDSTVKPNKDGISCMPREKVLAWWNTRAKDPNFEALRDACEDALKPLKWMRYHENSTNKETNTAIELIEQALANSEGE